MEEKNTITVKLSTVIIIIVLIAILFVGVIIYLKSTNKSEENIVATQSSVEDDDEENKIQNKVENEIENETKNEVTASSVISEKPAEEVQETITEGSYVLQGMTVSPDAESYGIGSIEIQGDNTFEVNLPLGTSYLGTYTVQENQIICTSTTQKDEEGGGEKYTTIDEIQFTFEIEDERNLIYIGSNADKSQFKLTMGKTYLR